MNKKSLWAVLAGVIFIVAVTTLVDILLHLAGAYPPMDQPLDDAHAILATAYRIVIGIIGGALSARLAPAQPMQHAIALGIVGSVLGLVGVVVTWNKELGPHWYPIALAVLALPQCWAGGRLYQMRAAAAAA